MRYNKKKNNSVNYCAYHFHISFCRHFLLGPRLARKMHSCVKCNFSSRCLSKLVIHYRFVHQHEHDFQLSCGVDGCSRTYKQTNSFIKHVKRKHPDFHDTHFSKWKNTMTCKLIMKTWKTTLRQVQLILKKQFALFLLHLRGKSKLPSNAVVAVVKEIIDMLGYHHAEVSDNIIKYIDETIRK